MLGVDFAPRMIERARRRYGGGPGLHFAVGDALALPFDDASFDAATIAFGMRNLADYRRGFEEMVRVVRPGGRVVCLIDRATRERGQSAGSSAPPEYRAARLSTGAGARSHHPPRGPYHQEW